MDSAQLLQQLRDLSPEEGRTYIQEHLIELADHTAISNTLADEALAQLYTPLLSLKLAEQLIFFGDLTHHLSAHALGLKAKGDVLAQIGHHQACLACLDAAGAEFLQLGDERNWARSRISWITASTSLGQTEEALQAAARAREVFQRLDELYWVCVIDHNTAWVYAETGRYQDAYRLLEQLLHIYPTLTDQDSASIQRAIAMAEEGQAQILTWLGKFDQAYKLHQQVLERVNALKETSLVIYEEMSLANLEYTQGYFGSALKRYYSARDSALQNNLADLIFLADLKFLIANCLVKLNRVQEGCQLMQEAVTAYRQRESSLQTSSALNEYAATLQAGGRLEEALAVLDEAVQVFLQGGIEHYASATKLQRAELLLQMGAVHDAYEEASQVKRYFVEHGLVARAVRVNLVLVGSLLQQAMPLQSDHPQRAVLLGEAISLCKQVARQAQEYHLREEVYKSQYLLGKLLAVKGDTARAAWHYSAAIAQIERMLTDLIYDLSPSFLQTAWAVYEDMIALCLQQAQNERAFNYLEHARSMALRQYLNTARTSTEIEQGKSAAPDERQANSAIILRTQDQLRSWQEKYRKYSVLLSQLDSSISPTIEREVIETELKQCEVHLNELFERLYLHQATLQPITQTRQRQPKPIQLPDIAHLRQQLLPEQLLLAYFLYKERLIIFAITREQVSTQEIADGARQLKRLLPLLHAHLQLNGWPNPQQPPHQASRQMLHKLYRLLIAPIASLLPPPSGVLTIIPYGPLHQLPFHALYDGTRFLIEHYQIHYLPASSVYTIYQASDQRQKRSAESSKPALIFGYSDQGHLQRALEEAETVARLLSGRCYLEEDATISRLNEQAAGSAIIHLATHGHSRLDAPNFSAVQLADGRFTAMDAFNLNLYGCELVTLSGCETGLALSGGGDEQLGLGRAFLAAGAHSLVMSLWPVEDNATNELMQLLYQHLLRGESKVQALRSAQCRLLRQAESTCSHPYFWAAFRLVGDAGVLHYHATTEQEHLLETH